MMARSNSEKGKRLISSYFTKLKGTKILLRGRDLSDMGFEPGPIYRDIFEWLLEARLNNRVKTKADEIKFVKKHFDPHL